MILIYLNMLWFLCIIDQKPDYLFVGSENQGHYIYTMVENITNKCLL